MSPSRFGSDPVGGPGRPAPASKPASSKAGLPLSRQAPFPSASSARPPSGSKTAGTTPPAPAAIPGRSAAVKNVRGPRPPARTPDPPRTPPVLVRQMRGGVVEARHRGSIVEVGVDGAVRRALGDPDTLVNLRSAVKPFGLVALIEAGGVEAFDLSDAELAIMAGSHSGEDLHVRTLQAVLRRAGVSQQHLGCGAEGAPLDALTAVRLARDGEKPGSLRHMCSGQHSSMLLLCRVNDWPLEGYWRPDHPVQRLYSATVARAFSTVAELLIMSTDACGVPTYAFPLREVARAFAMLADPAAIPAADTRSSLTDALRRIRDAMMANPEMVAGSRDRLDTSVMKASPGRIVAKGGAEGLRGFALLPGDGRVGASGVAIKIEDGGGFDRAASAASVETLRQIGVLDPAALRALGRYHRPLALDPRGDQAGEGVAAFELAPVGELL
ncbi:MAG: asparaginase [Candidatus Limnocylindrales bacterium]